MHSEVVGMRLRRNLRQSFFETEAACDKTATVVSMRLLEKGKEDRGFRRSEDW